MTISKTRVVPHAFIKWAGGKARVMGHILSFVPQKIDTYYEPFLGGGSVFFELYRQNRIKEAILADLNPELINCFVVIRDQVDDLLTELDDKSYTYTKTDYLKIRAIDTSTLSIIQRAARFVYLNKTCFNGLYRVNRQGKFNVPFGRYTNPVIKDEGNLRAASKALQVADIMCADFEVALKDIKIGDFAYFDPPYAPISDTSNFTSYVGGGFNEHDQRRLAELFSKISKKKISAVMSNSNAVLCQELYESYNKKSIQGPRSISGPAKHRNTVSEMIISTI